MEKSIIELLQYIPDEEWSRIKMKLDSKKALQKSEVLSAKRKSAVDMADWILSKGLLISTDDEGNSFWIIPDGKGKCLSSSDLYGEYIRDLMSDLDEDDAEDEMD